MKQFAAEYLITNTGPPLKRAIVTTADDGTVLTINDQGETGKVGQTVKFLDGIIIPGFVNCHCHLELSYLKNSIPRGSGLGKFIEEVRRSRRVKSEVVVNAAVEADRGMYEEGIVLCADICNTSSTFGLKKKSRIRYINLLEIFGIDPAKAGKRMKEINEVAADAEKSGLPYFMVPHSVYSLSLTLLRLIRDKSKNNRITSIHFMESPGEKEFLENRTGTLFTSYRNSGLIPPVLETVKNHTDAVLDEITGSGSLILVHDTYADRNTIKEISVRRNLFWCLCPNSNKYIENNIPAVDLLTGEGCCMVTGTDSLASNNKLSIIEELKTIQLHFPSVPLELLVRWATLNGAIALGEEKMFGSVEPGKRPGLILVRNANMEGMRLRPDSSATRLI
jgi:aminodeoxyfutalosine deaminase